LLLAGTRSLEPEAIFSFVARHPQVLVEPQGSRHSLKQRLITSVATYFRFFLPEESWSVAGCELRCGACRFDVVWNAPTGEIMVDEIKASRLQTRPERLAVEEQLERELAAGFGEWGSRFAGIRLIWLGAPLHSVLVHPNGARTSIFEADSG